MEDMEKTCGTCKYFLRHYTRRRENQYIPTAMGHCSNPRLREKQCDAPACQRYVRGAEAD